MASRTRSTRKQFNTTDHRARFKKRAARSYKKITAVATDAFHPAVVWDLSDERCQQVGEFLNGCGSPRQDRPSVLKRVPGIARAERTLIQPFLLIHSRPGYARCVLECYPSKDCVSFFGPSKVAFLVLTFSTSTPTCIYCSSSTLSAPQPTPNTSSSSSPPFQPQ